MSAAALGKSQSSRHQEEEFLGKDVMETSDSGHKTVGWPELWQWRGMRLESAMS